MKNKKTTLEELMNKNKTPAYLVSYGIAVLMMLVMFIIAWGLMTKISLWFLGLL